MVGLPIVCLATTELVSVICDGENGFIDTSPERLVDAMRLLLERSWSGRTWRTSLAAARANWRASASGSSAS